MFENMAIRILCGYSGTRTDHHGNCINRSHHAISMRLKGESTIEYNNQRRKVKAGDILYFPAHFDYKIDCEYEEIIVLHFEAFNCTQNELVIFTPQDADYYAELFQKIIKYTESASPSASLIATSELYRLLSAMEKEHEMTNSILTPGMRNAVAYLHNHFMDAALDIPMLTNIAAVSDTYFRRMFASVYNTTPIRYLNRLRIDYAYNLLLSGMYTVEEAAEKSGFSDPKYFSRIFKKYKGISPSRIKWSHTAQSPQALHPQQIPHPAHQ